MSLFDLSGKKALITGGTGVLGAQMARALSNQGAEVWILGRNTQKGIEIISTLKNAHFLHGDVTDEDSIAKAVQKYSSLNDHLDILINCAGGNLPGAVVMPDQTLEDIDINQFRKVFDLNLIGTLIPIKLFTGHLVNSEFASIINISSMTAERPLTRVAGYGASKASIDNLTKWLAVEMLSKYGEKIRVNAIAPGFFLTDQNRTLLTHPDGTFTERGQSVVDHTPMNRLGNPDDLDGAVIWLSGEGSKFVTGTVIKVDGGFSAYSGV